MAAILLMHKKEVAGDEIIEVKVWKVEKSKNYPEGIMWNHLLYSTISNTANDF